MSKIAVISDTHANSAALRAVMNDFIQRGATRIWMLGDMVGSGVDPIWMVRALAKLKQQQTPNDQLAWLKGNHDTFVTEPRKHQQEGTVSATQTMTVVPGDTIHMDTYNRDLLRPKNGTMDWIKGHPTHSHPYSGVYLAHAAYAFDDEGKLDEHATEHLRITDEHNAIAMLDAMHRHLTVKPKLVGFGHTHLTQLWRRNDWGSIERIPIEYGQPIHLTDLDRYTVLFNPGSVGFPKEHVPSPTYAIIECDEDNRFHDIKITFYTVSYDPTSMMQEVHGHLPGIFWKAINDLVQAKTGIVKEGQA